MVEVVVLLGCLLLLEDMLRPLLIWSRLVSFVEMHELCYLIMLFKAYLLEILA